MSNANLPEKFDSVFDRLSNSAVGVYSKCVIKSSIAGLDGVLTAQMMEKIAPAQNDLDALIAAALFERMGDDYIVHAWEETQPTNAQREKKRALSRARTARSRAKSSGVNVVVNVTVEAPAPVKKKKASEVTAVKAAVPAVRPAKALTPSQQHNQRELEQLGATGRKELILMLENSYPRKKDNGNAADIMKHLMKACTEWGIVTILDAADQFADRSKNWPAENIEPLVNWLEWSCFDEEEACKKVSR